MQYVNVIPLNAIPINKPQIYTYAFCADEPVKPGYLVNVPLYRKKTKGIVYEVSPDRPENTADFRLKNLDKILFPAPLATSFQLQLAYWISRYYCVSLGLVMLRMVPSIPVHAKAINGIDNLAIKSARSRNPNPEILALPDSERKKIYYKKIANAIGQNKQVLYLVPELAALEQAADELAHSFPKSSIALFHGSMGKIKYWKNWISALTGESEIILGTKQALLCPVSRPSLIIMEDEHSSSYKQWAMQPRYDGRKTAWKSAEITGSDIVFGSTAPTVSTYYCIPEKNIKKYGPLENRHINIVDMRDEIKGGNLSIFSDSLKHQLQNVLGGNKQAVLFVNRRANSLFVLCRDCGHIISCPSCSTSLVEYGSKSLACQHCGHKKTSPVKCPECGSTRIKGFGTGTEKVGSEIKRIFPDCETAILDQDHIKNKSDLKKIYQKFNTGQIDILVGTQMVLGIRSDFLRLAAAISVDSLLNMPDWLSGEKAMGLLSSLADFPGPTIIQTYNPDNQILTSLKNGEYDKYYDDSILQRKKLSYPPFSELVKLELRSAAEKAGKEEAMQLKKQLENCLPSGFQGDKTDIIGPKQAYVNKIKGEFVWQLILKIKKDRPFLADNEIEERYKWLALIPGKWSVDIEPDNLL